MSTSNKGKRVVATPSRGPAKPAGRASARKAREEALRKRKYAKRPTGSAAPKGSGTADRSDAKKVVRIDQSIVISELAHAMGEKVSRLLAQVWQQGLRGLTAASRIDAETAELLAAESGYRVIRTGFNEDTVTTAAPAEDGDPRAPIVCVLGHVDHGKTTLLDHLRKSNVAEGELGGITQAVGAYEVNAQGGKIVFLDTPGHEAFAAMRTRGAVATDLAVLVVASDDGVMPVTIEAIKQAQDAQTPVVVAVTKVDKPSADPGKVKQDLLQHGIVGEEFGGDVPLVEVSAKTGQGIDALLEALQLQAEVLELRAPAKGPAKGVVLETRIDKGRGIVTTLLVRSGTLKKGDVIVVGECSGKVRGLTIPGENRPLKSAGPSTPVDFLGLSDVPAVGDEIHVVANDREAKKLTAHRREQRQRNQAPVSRLPIEAQLKQGKNKKLKVVVKAASQGAAQAVRSALEGLSTAKVELEVLKAEVGPISQNDITEAEAGDAVVFGFGVGSAGPQSARGGVAVHKFGIIYEALDQAEKLMLGLLEPRYREESKGRAEVRQTFHVPGCVVAGCQVTAGLVTRNARVRVIRGEQQIFDGQIASLKVFDKDVKEVRNGAQCGLIIGGFDEVEAGDELELYELELIPPTL